MFLRLLKSKVIQVEHKLIFPANQLVSNNSLLNIEIEKNSKKQVFFFCPALLTEKMLLKLATIVLLFQFAMPSQEFLEQEGLFFQAR